MKEIQLKEAKSADRKGLKV